MKKIVLIIICITIILLFIFINMERLKAFIPNLIEDKDSKVVIGVLSSNDIRLAKIDAMVEGLKDYGYERENIELIIKNAKGEKENLNTLAEELAKENVDIIVTTGLFETSAAKIYAEEKNIPIVFIGVSCTVELGFIDDEISPGHNITGVDSHYVRLSGKRLEFLKRIIPDTEKVLILYNPLVTPYGPSSKFLYDAAEKLDIELELLPTDGRDEIIDTMIENHHKFDAIMLMCSLLFESTMDDIVSTSLEYKIPVIGVDDIQVEKGMLAFYGSTIYNEGFQASRLVANVLAGNDIKNMPIETPERLELYINVDTANALGIEIDYNKMTFVDKFIKK